MHHRAVEADRPAAGPLTLRRALLRAGAVAAIASVVLVAGAVNGVGPLACVTPAGEVADPREMLARSLQAVIDASSVHVVATVSGIVPGGLVGTPRASVTLDGTAAALDLRPRDARSHLAFRSPPLDLDLESVTLWDTLARRRAGEGWTRASLGALVGDSGIDANPLTLVGRLRTWLASPGAPVPTSADVACGAPSGVCRELQLEVGPEAGDVLFRLLQDGGRPGVGPTRTHLLLLTDASTLQPARLVLRTRDADGSLDVTATADFTGWDQPTVIPDPPGG